MGVSEPAQAAARARLAEDACQDRFGVVGIARRLVAQRSDNPPGDTRAIAAEVTAILADRPEIEIERHPGADHIMNLVMRLRGSRPGRRLVFNGHLDTFPLGAPDAWSADPLGETRDDRLYGLGVSDMKGGLAAILVAMRHLARHRDALAGEVVATFAGDEETMGVLGSRLLLDTVPHAAGDAMISADAGSPRVLRFGEKGMIWLNLSARGRSAHAAHVHRGDSAIEKLVDAITELKTIRRYPVEAPRAVIDAIAAAAPVSETLSGVGESDVLRQVTITFGTIRGGRLSNLIADAAEATADVRLPVGVGVAEIEAEIRRVALRHDVAVEVTRRYEPSWTAPDHEIGDVLAANCRAVLGVDPVLTMRVGASDARHYRAAGVPTIVCGLTPFNMGAADEYVLIDELAALGQIYALTAFDYLSSRGPPAA